LHKNIVNIVMPVIKTNKQYDSLVTFGCSFTGGHNLGDNGAWGHFFAKRLGCKHVIRSGGGSNTNICAHVINYCENNDMTNKCIGIQWSEVTRRELWEENNSSYYTIGLGILLEDSMWKRESNREWLSPIKNNLGYFSSVWFDLRENIMRTVLAMIQAKAYLEYRNIDFIQFEGINSIINREKNHQEVRYDGEGHPSDLALISDNIRSRLFNDDTFFDKQGDLMKFMNEYPTFDPSINDGHPYNEILEDWTTHMWNYLLTVQKT